MLKWMPRLIILTILLASLNADIDYKQKYEQQVANNITLRNHIVYQDKLISDQDKQIEIQKVKEHERMLLIIPFTDIGLSKDWAIGFIVGYVICIL